MRNRRSATKSENDSGAALQGKATVASERGGELEAWAAATMAVHRDVHGVRYGIRLHCGRLCREQ